MASKNDRSLIKASERGDADGVRRLLKAGANPWAVDKNGMTALMWAAYRGRMKCVMELLPASDALARNKDGKTASDWAEHGCHQHLADLLKASEEAQQLRESIQKPSVNAQPATAGRSPRI